MEYFKPTCKYFKKRCRFSRFKEERKIIEDSIIKGSNEGCYFKPRLYSRSLQRCANALQ